MAYYTVYWPQDWLDELRKSDDNGDGVRKNAKQAAEWYARADSANG